MAGVSDTTTIDVVAQDAAGEYMVLMVEERPWDADPAQELQLRDKINLYADFILGGGLAQHYPETLGQPVRVQLDCVQEPVGAIAAVVQLATEQLQERGVGFTVNVQD